MTVQFSQAPLRGAGIGLRSQHYSYILARRPAVNWFEILSDNYLHSGGLPLYHLEQIRNYYPITLHGVGLSLGSADPLDKNYLKRLKYLAERFQPAHISEHLAWTSINGCCLHDLIPLPYTETILAHVAQRILQVQDFLGQRLLIENPSSYLRFTESTLTEWEFINRLIEKTDCNLLLDINNVYVSAINHQYNPLDYLKILPPQRVKEIHLAGYEQRENYLFDTHGYQVHPPVWELYQTALTDFGPVPTLIEWDTDIPDFEILLTEAHKANHYLEQTFSWN
ncbi:MAG: hypothetical protein BWK79_09280 [Beggiatoa sp. IS2]|nr:MAG: hypothetical protein BWK79_09280 [Beggiatoa sp. IS2]